MSPTKTNFTCFQLVDLCSACKGVLQTQLYDAAAPIVTHHTSQQSLAIAIKQRCYVCSIVLSHIQDDQNKIDATMLQPVFETKASIYTVEAKESFIKLEIYLPTIELSVVKFRLIPYAGNVGKAELSSDLEWLSNETSSFGILDLALKWYNTCCNSHPGCRLSFTKQKDWQPTRLISIGCAGDDQWKLVETPIPDWPVEYMTLSYRWNLQPGKRLLEHNIDQFRSGLPVTYLPRTFQDAIMVARHFSVRYIWIDAICIIQDSPEDWMREARAMHYIYSHSTCNIAASAATDQYSGLFSRRNAQAILPGLISHPESSGTLSQNYLIFDKEYWNRQLMHGPLHNRGWVFQECLLAPRVIYFAESQILWDCFYENKCEGFPKGIPYHERLKDITPLWKAFDDRGSDQANVRGGMTFQLRGLWNKLVEGYTACDLTDHSDKLPAFSGIEKLFAAASGDEYVAGLWRSSLIEQLLWHVVIPSRHLPRSNAPSWSWAATNGKIRMTGLSHRLTYLVSIITAVRHHRTEDLIDKALRISLHLTGKISVLGRNTRESSPYNHLGSILLNASYYPDNLDVDFQGVKHELYFLPVLSAHPWHPPRLRSTKVLGLVMTLLSEESPCVFQRVGMFTTESLQDIERLGLDISSEGLAAFNGQFGLLQITIR